MFASQSGKDEKLVTLFLRRYMQVGSLLGTQWLQKTQFRLCAWCSAAQILANLVMPNS
jgi:hypothetical protein